MTLFEEIYNKVCKKDRSLFDFEIRIPCELINSFQKCAQKKHDLEIKEEEASDFVEYFFLKKRLKVLESLF